MRVEWKLVAPKMNMSESDVDDEFAEATAIIIASIVAKDKLKSNES